MSCSAQEAICLLRQFVDQPGERRFHVIPETTAVVDSHAFSFMESCWDAAVRDATNATTTTTIPTSETLTSGHLTPSVPLRASTRNATVVRHDTPLATVSTGLLRRNSDAGGFFNTALVQAQPVSGARCGRNGVAWVVL